MIDRDLQDAMLRRMAENGGAANLAPPAGTDATQCARNLLDLELQGLCKGGVSISGSSFQITGDTTLTDAGRAYLERKDEMHLTLNASDAIDRLRQRVATDTGLSDTERHDLTATVNTLHPLALRALGRELLERALENSPDAIPLLKKHANTPTSSSGPSRPS